MSYAAATTGSSQVPTGPIPKYTEPFRQRGRLALIIMVAIVAVAGVAGAIYISAAADAMQGAVLSIGYALVPLPMLWFSYWWLDRYEPEPRRYLVAAFVWGAVISVVGAIVLQIWISNLFTLTDAEMATFIAPVTEEPLKAAFLIATFARARRVIDGVLDGLIFCGLVGVGFAFVENIGYYAASYLGGPEYGQLSSTGATTMTFIVRGIFSPLAHPMFTSAFGIGLGLAVMRRSWWAKIGLISVGLSISILLHGLWNGAASYGGAAVFLLMYLILSGVLIIMVVLAVVLRMRQVKTLQRSLEYVAVRGWIHPAEVDYLTRFSMRARARKYAKKRYGKTAADAVATYQKYATEMAFLHDRVMQGQRVPHGVERTYALLDAMRALRPYLRLPPPLPGRRMW